ncbi:acyl carrier protein [Streptomyces sp. HF10]|uniref:acyl carrier protein n=1 Tax=Streptomyces sp. HF10 TaxID=2692233 RepID=UPI001915875D|nr:acyl carrier protein [Streptomyces sp. HF10]
MVSHISLPRLVQIIRECAGDSDEQDLDGDILDVTFQDLGYDSLALLEISAKIEQDFGVSVPEGEIKTPRNTLQLINSKITEEVA